MSYIIHDDFEDALLGQAYCQCGAIPSLGRGGQHEWSRLNPDAEHIGLD